MAASEQTVCTIVTACGKRELTLRTASSFLSRFCGLMLRRSLRPTEGMLITHCSSVHTALMRFPIDVVYLDHGGVVTRCVSGLKPWRASYGGFASARSTHVLEFAAGAIDAFGIAPGDRLHHPCFAHRGRGSTKTRSKQRGSAMIEFAVVGPLITLLGLGTLQYAMIFFAKNQINYASFMAAREGSFAHADLGAIQRAYVRALAPMYGGGETPEELAASVAKAGTDMAGNVQIEMLNPTKESFAEWKDEKLQALLKTGGKRVIPNVGLAVSLKTVEVKQSSGQSLQDANLLKLKITHGYLPKVPIIGKLYLAYLKWSDPHTDNFQTQLISDGRIPVITHVTIEMQSDAIEPDDPISTPGAGNGGKPTNPGSPPPTQGPAPDCTDLNCSQTPTQSPDPTPACNPFLDPNRCESSSVCPAQQCCAPSNITLIP